MSGLALALFAYAVWFRTHGLAESFALRGDQIRDWTIALRSFSDLPLTGVPSTAGGATIGPAFYWFLWAVARIVGPFTDYLPHAGGIGIAAAHSLADTVLFAALARRLTSIVLALALVLLVVTAPYDATLSGTIWNPPMAEAFSKLSVALLLWNRMVPHWRSALAVAFGWMAVHCHTGAALVAGPVLLWIVTEPLVRRDWHTAFVRVAGAASVIALLQVPWLITRVEFAGEQHGNRIGSSLSMVFANPESALRVRASVAFVAKSAEFLVFAPLQLPYFSWVFAVCAIATTLLKRDFVLFVVGAGCVIAAVGAFALLQGELSEVYWCLALTAPVAVAALGWIDGMPPSARTVLAAAVLVAILAAQPLRASVAWTFHRVPEYGAIVRGCRAIISGEQPVREVAVDFVVPYDTNPMWVFSVLGGTIESGPEARRAVIGQSGAVRYEQ